MIMHGLYGNRAIIVPKSPTVMVWAAGVSNHIGHKGRYKRVGSRESLPAWGKCGSSILPELNLRYEMKRIVNAI
jgi:hypothetical protein